MSAALVVLGLAAILMNITANFDNKFMAEADKIDNKNFDGVLSAKFST